MQGQTEAAGEVVGGAEREHAQAHVAVGELVCRLAQGSVPAAYHDQIGAAVGGREAGAVYEGEHESTKFVNVVRR